MKHTLWFAVRHIPCSLILLCFLSAFSSAQPSKSIPVVQYGVASWYGEKFHGRQTANGEVYNMFQLTAAHKFAPLGIHAIVTNLDSGRSVQVRINDRGPFVGNRILDLSYASARRLGMVKRGLAQVKVQFLLDTAPPVPIFIVQAGAYTARDNAARVQKALAIRYPQVWISVAREGAQIFYRVRLGAFTDRTMAERVANRVQNLGYRASVVPIPRASYALKPSANQF
ncbi:MAG: septal ring lytic transglycosylase RlpA family protein [Candidatus Tectomicrobia bacterium]